MTKKTDWQIKQETINTKRKKGLKAMTKDQKESVKKAWRAIESVLTSIREVEDVYLSDIRELDKAYWDLNHEFKLNEE
jgi:hypothetical protein